MGIGGGRMKEKCSDLDYLTQKIRNLMRAQAAMYMTMAQEALKLDERIGEKAVRGWMRALGTWRGIEMRKGHQAMGYPINMESIMRYWDNPSTFHIDDWQESGDFKPHDTKVCVTSLSQCNHAQFYSDHNFWHFGHIFCEELHQSVASGYHPDAVVVIPIILTKGDDRCDFRWMLPPDATEPEALVEKGDETYTNLWKADTPLNNALSSLTRAARITGVYIYFMVKEVVSHFGDEGKIASRRALRRAGWLRGAMLKRFQEESAESPSAFGFLQDFDHPFSCLSMMELKEENGKKVGRVSFCPLDDVWKNLGGREFGSFYCEETYNAMLAEYLPEATFQLLKARSWGDST